MLHIVIDKFIKLAIGVLDDVFAMIYRSNCDISSTSLDEIVKLRNRLDTFIDGETYRRENQQARDAAMSGIEDVETSEYASSIDYSREQ